MTLIEALTQHLPTRDGQNQLQWPPGIPRPLQQVIANCLASDPGQRWTAAQIADRMSGTTQVSSPTARAAPVQAKLPEVSGEKPSKKWAYIIPLIAVVLLAVLFFLRPKATEVKPASQPAEQNSSERTSSGGGTGTANPLPPAADVSEQSDGRVATRVDPQVSAGAQRTIQGKIRVQIDVNVDETGKVTDARFKSVGPSRYFAERAMAAARQWTFKPPVENGQAVASEWRVKFMIGRSAINDSAERIKP